MQALAGVTVLDLTRYLPGSFATMLLAELGAEVIMIEQPGKGEPGRAASPKVKGISMRHLLLQRNKRSMTLNLNSSEGRTIFFELVKKADVVVENFRPSYLKKQGLDYPSVQKVNPGIIYCSLSGFGHSGSKQDVAGHDLNYMGWSGILGLGGNAEGIAVPGIQMADMSGSMMGIIGILTALYARQQSGRGQYLDIAFLDSAISLLPLAASSYFAKGESYGPGEHLYAGSMAWYNVYKTRDGRHLTLGTVEKKFWDTLCDTLGLPEYKDAQFDRQKQDELKRAFTRIFKTKTLREWMEILQPLNLCSGPVLTVGEVFQDANTAERGMVYETEHPQAGRVMQIGCPIHFSETPSAYRLPAPGLGEHTTEILQKLGYCSEEIQTLQANKVI